MTLLVCTRAHDGQVTSLTPIFKRSIIQSRVVAEILRDEVDEACLLAYVTIANYLIAGFDTCFGENLF